jgi:mono/diheme cytochrome c family protein
MSKTLRMVLIGLGLLVAAFVAMQLLPVWLLQTNPPVLAEPKWDSPATRALAQRACFDCHSNETSWPLYARLAPVSWLVTLDVIRGRGHLNFSEWGLARGEGREGGERGGREFGELIASGAMPPSSYVLTHPNARLTEAEQQQLIDGLTASLK